MKISRKSGRFRPPSVTSFLRLWPELRPLRRLLVLRLLLVPRPLPVLRLLHPERPLLRGAPRLLLRRPQPSDPCPAW
jgi:hypothetical protein